MKLDELKPEFVRVIPDPIESGVLYVSMEFQITMHLCPCGCKEPVVCPIKPEGWDFTEDNGLVTLSPSISNAQFCPNRSHYYVKQNRIIWL